MGKIIRAGIVGAGNIARRYHMKGYMTSENTEIVAVTDVVREVAEDAAKLYGIPKVYDNYEQMLEDDSIDCISICVPNKFHAPITIAAAKAGKHVLCEKPIALSMAEVEAMREAIRSSGIIAMVEFPMRFDSGYRKAKQLIEQGSLGQVVLVKSSWCHGGPEMYTKGTWFFSPEMAGGGTLIDLGVHVIDILRWLVGDIAQSTGYISTLTKPISVEDNAVLALRFANGTLGLVDSSWSVKAVNVQTEIFGTKGRLVIKDSPVTSITAHFADELSGNIVFDHIKDTGDQDPHVKCVRHFVSCIARGEQPDTATFDDGAAALETILNVYEGGGQK